MGFKILKDFNNPRVVGELFEESTYQNGEIMVRLKDDDGQILYHAFVDDPENSCTSLMNWAKSNSDATELEIHIDNYKQLFGEPSYKYLISKDKQWHLYMV